jgi:hypothetical protein
MSSTGRTHSTMGSFSLACCINRRRLRLQVERESRRNARISLAAQFLIARFKMSRADSLDYSSEAKLVVTSNTNRNGGKSSPRCNIWAVSQKQQPLNRKQFKPSKDILLDRSHNLRKSRLHAPEAPFSRIGAPPRKTISVHPSVQAVSTLYFLLGHRRRGRFPPAGMI